MKVDDLAQEIRRVGGHHSLGAGALAEALMPFIDAHLARGERDGWKLVPHEPTPMMVAKGTEEHICEQMDSYYQNTDLSDVDCIAIYKSMIAAAPESGGV